MEVSQKTTLITVLNVNLKITNLDPTCIADINSIADCPDMQDHEKCLVYNSIEDKLLKTAETDYEFVESVITGTTLANKNFLLTMTKGVNLIRNVKEYNLKDYITESLAREYIGLTPAQEYSLYKTLVRVSIIDGTPETIQKTMDKLQSI